MAGSQQSGKLDESGQTFCRGTNDTGSTTGITHFTENAVKGRSKHNRARETVLINWRGRGGKQLTAGLSEAKYAGHALGDRNSQLQRPLSCGKKWKQACDGVDGVRWAGLAVAVDGPHFHRHRPSQAQGTVTGP